MATTQAICDYRRQQGYDGPLFIGRDTHGLSEPAWASALEVLVANDVTVLVDDRDRYTPTPRCPRDHPRQPGKSPTGSGLPTGSSSRRRTTRRPDGGFKYNPPHGGPADTDATVGHRGACQRADQGRPSPTCAGPVRAGRGPHVGSYDFLGTYVDDLPSVLDLDAIREAACASAPTRSEGASVDYWGAIAERRSST